MLASAHVCMSVSACMHKQMGVCLVCVCIRNNELAALMFANIVFLEIVHPCRWTGIFWYSHHFMLLSLFFSQCFYFGTKSNECVTTLYINFYNLWLNRLWAVVRSTYTWSNWPVASVSVREQLRIFFIFQIAYTLYVPSLASSFHCHQMPFFISVQDRMGS